jgi:CheY-like chemotaxis protein
MTRTPTVLVVEDTAIAREPLVRLLRYEGYNAIGVTNGYEALGALASEPADIVLLDILMPVMNGLQFLESIRGDARWEKLPVIVLTAVQDEVCERDARSMGVQGFIQKTGFSLPQLLGMIREQLGSAA